MYSDGSLLADRHGFPPLEKRSEMISVPVIMTAMNLLSTDAHPRVPSALSLAFSLQTVSVTYSIQVFPAAHADLQFLSNFWPFLWRNGGECHLSVWSVPKVKEKSTVHTATGHWGKITKGFLGDHTGALGQFAGQQAFMFSGLVGYAFCGFTEANTIGHSPLIINFCRKRSECKLSQIDKIHPKTCCSQVILPVKRWYWLKLNRKDTDLRNKAFLLYFVH